MDGEGVGALDGISDGLKDVLGLGEGEVEAAAQAALLDAARGEDASGWEGAATGGNSVDELAGWDGIKKEEITDGLIFLLSDTSLDPSEIRPINNIKNTSKLLKTPQPQNWAGRGG